MGESLFDSLNGANLQSEDEANVSLSDVYKFIRKETYGSDDCEDDPFKNKEIYEKLVKTFQANDDDEAVINSLDNSSLRAHMDGARSRLAAQEMAMAAVPSMESLRRDYINLNVKMTEMSAKLSTQIEEANMHIRVADCVYTARDYDKLMGAYNGTYSFMKEFDKDFCVIKREYQRVVDDLMKTCKNLDTNRMMQRELLESVSHVYNAENPRD